MSLVNKIDFAVIFSVKNVNPNGDPLNGNRPRQNYDGFGEVSDVCLKRKMRNRLQAMGENIFVQMDENRIDEHRSLNARFTDAIKEKPKNETIYDFVNKKWFDVRTFGQVFAFKDKNGNKGKKKDEEASEDYDENGGSVSIGIRGPVTLQSAFSIEPIITESLQITKTVNLENEKVNDYGAVKKGADTMGMKHRVNNAVYVSYGSISPQLAEKTNFSDEDAEIIKKVLQSLFIGDESSARPSGSMEVKKVVWWKHNSLNGQYSSAKVHRSLKVEKDGSYTIEKLENLIPEELDEKLVS